MQAGPFHFLVFISRRNLLNRYSAQASLPRTLFREVMAPCRLNGIEINTTSKLMSWRHIMWLLPVLTIYRNAPRKLYLKLNFPNSQSGSRTSNETGNKLYLWKHSSSADGAI